MNEADAWKMQIHWDHLMQPGSIYKLSLLQPGSWKMKLKTFMNIGELRCLFMRKLEAVLHIYHHLVISSVNLSPPARHSVGPIFLCAGTGAARFCHMHQHIWEMNQK